MKKNIKNFFVIRSSSISIFFRIIKKTEDFKRVLQLNKKFSCRHCSAFYGWLPQKQCKELKNADEVQNELISAVGVSNFYVRVGYIASKKLGAAVWRNRAKRCLRAALLSCVQKLERNGEVAERLLGSSQSSSQLTEATNKIEESPNYALNLLLAAKGSTGNCDFKELIADIGYILRKAMATSAVCE